MPSEMPYVQVVKSTLPVTHLWVPKFAEIFACNSDNRWYAEVMKR